MTPRRPTLRPRTRLRRIAAVTLAGAITATLSACAGGGGANPSLTATGPITIWYSNNAQEIAWGQQMVKAWNAAHPDQKVTAEEIPAGKTSEEVEGAAITAGNAPCLSLNLAPFIVGQFQKQGGLVDLSKFPDGNSYIQARSGDLADQYKSPDGGYYQMPWKSNPVVIFYNKKLFEKAGLDPNDPKLSTYSDFLATAKALKKAGVAPVAIQPDPTNEFFEMDYDFYPLYAAASGGKLLIQNGKATFGDSTGAQVADFWRAMYADGLSSPEAYQNGDAFQTGYAAMAIVGPWAVAQYKGTDWGSVPVPTPDGTPVDQLHTYSDAKNIGMFTACQNKGTAWNVLKFATSADQDAKFLSITGQMPIRPDLATRYAAYFKAHPSYSLFGSLASRTIDVPAGPNTVQQLQTFRNDWTSSVIFGHGPPADAIRSAADSIDQLEAQP